MIDINALQATITLSTDRDQVKKNREAIEAARAALKAHREAIEAARAALKAQLEMVAALDKSNRHVCKHPYKNSWTDYGGGHNTGCPDCGGSW